MTEAAALAGAMPPAEAHADRTAVAKFGFWVYLMSDLVLFATLFATYTVLRGANAGGPSGRELFDLAHVFGETLLLLLSSASCGLSMAALHADRKGLVVMLLGVTFLLGGGFIAMEAGEFQAMLAAGNGPQRSAFLSAFFTLVGTHGAHVSAGLVWMLTIVAQVLAKGLTARVRTQLLCFSMFWHFLDIVWIGVFTVVYLLGAT